MLRRYPSERARQASARIVMEINMARRAAPAAVAPIAKRLEGLEGRVRKLEEDHGRS
jgi:hypothetical protein